MALYMADLHSYQINSRK